MIYKNLVHKFEFTIRELLGAEMSPTDIHSLANMVFNDWLVDGEFTQEYKEMAVKAIQLREAADEPARPNIVNLNGERLN
jgi:hypothetical protein